MNRVREFRLYENFKRKNRPRINISDDTRRIIHFSFFPNNLHAKSCARLCFKERLFSLSLSVRLSAKNRLLCARGTGKKSFEDETMSFKKSAGFGCYIAAAAAGSRGLIFRVTNYTAFRSLKVWHLRAARTHSRTYIALGFVYTVYFRQNLPRVLYETHLPRC